MDKEGILGMLKDLGRGTEQWKNILFLAHVNSAVLMKCSMGDGEW